MESQSNRNHQIIGLDIFPDKGKIESQSNRNHQIIGLDNFPDIIKFKKDRNYKGDQEHLWGYNFGDMTYTSCGKVCNFVLGSCQR